MAESDSAADALLDEVAESAHLLVLIPAAAVAAPLVYADDERWEGKEEHGDSSLEQLFSLIRGVVVADGDYGNTADDLPSIAVGGKRTLSPPSASDSSPAAESPPPTTTRKVKKRRHHEVLRLRKSVAELEIELNTLKHRQDKAEWFLQFESGDSGDLKWQKAAKKAMQAAARARLENAKLKENAKAQVELVRSLQETLSKRKCSPEELQQIVVPHQQTSFTISRPSDPKEREIYGLLIKSVYDRTCQLDEVFRVNGLADAQCISMMSDSTISESKVLLNENQALCIDLVNRYIIPFDFQASSKVLWAHVLSKSLKLNDQRTQTEIIVATDDVIVTKQSANSNFLIEDHNLTTEYSISKRVCDSNCVSFLWESITESKGALASSQGTPAIQLIQHGWGRVSQVDTVNGSSAASLHSYVRLTPSTIKGDSDHGGASQQFRIHQQFDVEMLSAHIISSFQQHVASVRCFIENALIDDMIQASKPSPPKYGS